MHEEVTMSQFTCDGCGKEFVVRTHDGPPVPWFNGEVIHHWAGGGHGGDWDACSEKCIRKAVLAAVNRND